uniref:Decapping nuclease n=2 Tax=Caenorhabditis japonica TaxID=281687 RepID=A0A8R1HXM7_CAEJA
MVRKTIAQSVYFSGNGDGYKFEQNMTLDINGRPNSFNAPVSNAECTKRVYRAKFGNGIDHVKVYYAAELDAIDSADRLIEFKTTMLREIKWLERLSLSHYLQAFFGGVPIIVYGHKKFQMNVKHYDNHIIDRVSRKDVSEIPLKARHQWNLSDRMNTMFDTLKTIKDMLPHDDKAILVRIRHGKLNEYIEEPVEDCNFVNDDFLDFFT